MASGLGVLDENILFFYVVMLTGFLFTGFIVSCYAYKIADTRKRGSFFTAYGVLIWCAFDLTMIPLGFGALATILFITISLIAFTSIRIVCNLLS